MRADIEEFARLARVTPRAGEALPWAACGRAVGIRLPADYRAFVDAFGGGEVYERLGVSVPRTSHDDPDDPDEATRALRAMLDNAARTGAIMRDHRDHYPARFPYAFYPEPGGLLSWGSGIGGEECFWLTEDSDPDAWPVVVWDAGSWHRYDTGMVGTVLHVVTGDDPFLRALFHDEDAPVWLPDH